MSDEKPTQSAQETATDKGACMPPVVPPIEVISPGVIAPADDGPLGHVDSRVRHLVSATKAARIKYVLSDRLIVHKDLGDILNRVYWLIEEPRKSRSRGEIYLGIPGSGKSSISQLVQRAYPLHARELTGGARPKVLAITISGARHTKTVLERILHAARSPTRSRTAGKHEPIVIDTLKRMDCRLLILDELQDLGKMLESEQVRVLETIKLLMNEAKLSVLGLGSASAEKAFDADEHLAARFKSYAIPTWKEGEELAIFLRFYERSLPLAHRSDLERPAMQKTLIRRSGGQLDSMLLSIKDAAVHAIVNGIEQITQEMLEHELPRPPIEELIDRAR